MKVKFLCRLLNRHKQQMYNLLTIDSEDRVREDMIAGAQVYEEFGLPPFALLYEGEEVVGFFILLCVEEDSDGELVAEGRFYIRGNEKLYVEYLIQSLKEEYEELRHLSVLSEEKVPYLAFFPHYAECFMRLSRESNINRMNNSESNYCNREISHSYKEIDKTLFQIEPIDNIQGVEIQFYLEVLKDIFFMDEEVANQHLKECLDDCDCNLYVVKIDKKIIGTCGAYIGTKSNTIFDIAICQSEQGKGYGRLLLAELLSKLNHPSKDIILQVSTKSEAAFHLYEEYGFDIEQRLFFYEVW